MAYLLVGGDYMERPLHLVIHGEPPRLLPETQSYYLSRKKHTGGSNLCI
jgi:hypothetical protein